MNTPFNPDTLLKTLYAEEHNLTANRLNFVRTKAQYNIGQVTSVEFRQAQMNLLTAATKYNTKALELQLLQLSSDLLRAQY